MSVHNTIDGRITTSNGLPVADLSVIRASSNVQSYYRQIRKSRLVLFYHGSSSVSDDRLQHYYIGFLCQYEQRRCYTLHKLIIPTIRIFQTNTDRSRAFFCRDLDFDSMTLIFELDLDVPAYF